MPFQSSLAQGTDPLFPVRQFWDTGFRGKPSMEGYYQPPGQTEAQARAALSLAPTLNQQAYQNQIANRGLDIQDRQVGVQERALDKFIQMNRTSLPFHLLQAASGITANNAIPNLINTLTGLPAQIAGIPGQIATGLRNALPSSWFTQGNTPAENLNLFGGLGDTRADITAGGGTGTTGTGTTSGGTTSGGTTPGTESGGGSSFLSAADISRIFSGDYLTPQQIGALVEPDWFGSSVTGGGLDLSSETLNQMFSGLGDTFDQMYYIDWGGDFGIDFSSIFNGLPFGNMFLNDAAF